MDKQLTDLRVLHLVAELAARKYVTPRQAWCLTALVLNGCTRRFLTIPLRDLAPGCSARVTAPAIADLVEIGIVVRHRSRGLPSAFRVDVEALGTLCAGARRMARREQADAERKNGGDHG